MSRCMTRYIDNAIIIAVVLYGCQTWTLMQSTVKRIQAFEMRFLRRLLNVSYLEHRTNESVLQEVEQIIGPYTRLITRIKQLKLKWFGHVTRHDCFSRVFLQGRVPGSRARGRPRRNWCDDIRNWTELSCNSLSRLAQDRCSFRQLVSQCTC